MQLVADRFAVEDDGRVVDLATGALVTLTVGSAGGVTEQLRWAARCDRLRTLHHQAIAPLLDFGVLGETSRFEAWCCGLAVARCAGGRAIGARRGVAVSAGGRIVSGVWCAGQLARGSERRGVDPTRRGRGLPE